MSYPYTPEAPPPQKPDTRVFASYPMPAKIDLLNERPRHEVAIEQQLGTRITSERAPSRSSVSPAFSDLAAKEAKLMEEIANLQRRPYSPYELPAKIDLSIERTSPRHLGSPRPRSTADAQADLINKEIQLLEEIAEFEKKPYNPQKILLEHEKWYEYPRGHPEYRQVVESKHRVRDFCSLPSHLYPDDGVHMREENVTSARASPVSSMHTAVINVPNRAVDNRSPLPFSFDNFSTKGVRGNIATVGAVPPERPYPPICHSVRRGRSPITGAEDRH